MSDESAEQQQTQEPGPATREDLIAAAREAGGIESADAGAEEHAAAEQAAAAAQTTTPAEEEEPRIAALLRAREKAAAEREAGRNQVEEMLARAREESERLIREARERAERDYQEDLARRRKAFEESPIEAVRALGGGDPQRVVDAVLRDGTPEARALREMQRELAETKQQASSAAEVRKELEQFKQAQAAEAHNRAIAQVRETFLGNHANQEKAPYLNARYDQDQIFSEAWKLAVRWQDGGMVLGKDFDYDDVTQYLEVESKKRLTPILGSTPAQQSGAGASAREPGIAPKSAANGSRTITAASGSERRASPKAFHEMTPDEQREDLVNEVRKVYRQFGKT